MSLKLLFENNRSEYLRQLNDPDLKVINLDYVRLNTEQFDIILERLKLNNSVLRLSFSGCRLGLDSIQKLAEVLAAKDNQIGILNLSENNFGPRGIQYISEALANNLNSKLYDLDLRGAGAGLPGAVHIAIMLQSNTTLRTLNLAAAHMGDEGISHLVTALQSNPNSNLTNLILSVNNITNPGAIKLAEFLSTNPTLKKLILRLNEIQVPGLTALLESLQVNTNLEELDLSENIILDEGDEDIDVDVYLDFIKFNSQITMINLHRTGIYLDDIEEIEEITTRNKHNKAINSKTLIDILKEYKK